MESTPAPVPEDAGLGRLESEHSPAWTARWARVYERLRNETVFCAMPRDEHDMAVRAARFDALRDGSFVVSLTRAHYLVATVLNEGRATPEEVLDLRRAERGQEPLLRGDCSARVCPCSWDG